MAIGDIIHGGSREALSEKILSGLNPEQREVVLHHEGPLLVIAVAGAGKTAAVVRRIAYLTQVHRVQAGRILAVTFSRKGADEMDDRLEALIGKSDARIGTFHSLALEIVKKEIAEIADWTIDDRNRYRLCIKDAYGYKKMNWDKADATVLESYIGTCKCNLARPMSEFAIAEAERLYRKSPGPKTMPRKLLQCYEIAEELRRERRLLTFDDMLMDAVELLQSDEGVRQRWAARWDFVIQDEAQDQNLAQLMMGELLGKDHKNYMLVGDPAQTIYTWRGAQPKKLLSFEQDWGARVITMGRNYRCGDCIIDAANLSLDAMDPTQRLPVSMIAERGVPGEIVSKLFIDLDAEGEEVAARCLELGEGGMKWSDMVVLYRTNAQSRAIEESMLSARIPYRILGGTNFYERREVRSLLSYLRLADGRGDIEDIERCINSPFRYLARAFVERVTDAAKVAKAPINWPALVRDVANQAGLQTRQRESAYQWADMIASMTKSIQLGMEDGSTEAQRDAAKPARMLELLNMTTGYTRWLEKDEGEESTENSRVSNVRELIRAAGRFPTVADLLGYIEETMRKAAHARKNTQPNKVTMTTLHRSKGQEWPVVFLVGCSEGILPHARAEDLEEERRLFYVGVTRARDTLHVSAVTNVSFGNRVITTEPSSFLHESGIKTVPVLTAASRATTLDMD